MQSPRDKAMAELVKIRAEIASGNAVMKKSHLLGTIDAILSLHETIEAREEDSSKDA
jgi:hypothetical protein